MSAQKRHQRNKILLACAFLLASQCFSFVPASGQEFVWSSMFEVASKVYEDKDYQKAEKLALEAVEEAEKLPKEGKQLLKSLHLLRLIYLGMNNSSKAEEVSVRIVSLGGSGQSFEKTESQVMTEHPPQDKVVAGKTDNSTKISPGQHSQESHIKDKEEVSPAEQKSQGKLEFTVETDDKIRSRDKPPAKIATATVGLSGDFQADARVSKAKEIFVMPGHNGWTKTVDVSPDGSQAASGSVDETIRLWDLSTGRECGKFEGHEDAVNCVVFSPSGNQILSGSSDKTVRLWDIDSGNEIRKFIGHTNLVTCVAFAPVGSRIASSGYDGVIRIWDSSSGKELAHTEGYLGTVRCLAFTPDGEQLVAGCTDKTISLWRARDAHKIRTFTGHKQEISSLAVSLDGTRILSASRDLTLRVWDLGSGDELKCLSGHNNWIVRANFLSADKAITGSLDKTFRIWDLDEGKETRIFSIQHYGMWSLAFTESGDRAITGSDDFSMRVWSLK